MDTHFVPTITVHLGNEKFNTIIALLEKTRIAAKKVLNYQWDNDHFMIVDGCGRPALKIAVYDDEFVFWSMDSRSVGSISKKEWNNDPRACNTIISDWANHAGNGEHRCTVCQKWTTSGHTYDFAGYACNECYNPKKHLPPDTRGAGEAKRRGEDGVLEYNTHLTKLKELAELAHANGFDIWVNFNGLLLAL